MNLVDRLSLALTWVSSLTLVTKNIILLVLLFAHLYLSIVFKDFIWLSSFGSLVTLFGAIIIFNYSLPYKDSPYLPPKYPVKKHQGGYSPILGTEISVEIINDQQAEILIEKFHEDHNIYRQALLTKRYKVIASLSLTVVGTLIWSYAGYLNLYFFPSI